jgi:hypothetical protein
MFNQLTISLLTNVFLFFLKEAAANYVLNGLDPHGLNVDDTFVVCDAGGGTVDLISYTIMQLQPILKVKEAAAGTGGLCGSTFLNRRFADYLVAKLGNEPDWDAQLLAEAVNHFDTVVSQHCVRYGQV